MPKINQEEYEVLKELDDKWKWIARDKDRGLYAFAEKPVRKYDPSPYWDTETEWPYSAFESLDEIHLFQFIQWEDEDPYNIAELIEEYEYHNEPVKLAGGLSITQAKYDKYLEEHIKELENESEETEVKNMKWFKKKLDDIEVNTTSLQKHDAIWMLNRVHELIDQLDEPEVLSQEWIDENKVYYDNWMPAVPIIHLQNLLVPKQEEVTHKQVEKYLLDKNIRVIDIDIYEEMQSELEELKNDATLSKTETVADVVTTFWKSFERLKEVMSMEVEELEE